MKQTSFNSHEIPLFLVFWAQHHPAGSLVSEPRQSTEVVHAVWVNFRSICYRTLCPIFTKLYSFSKCIDWRIIELNLISNRVLQGLNLHLEKLIAGEIVVRLEFFECFSLKNGSHSYIGAIRKGIWRPLQWMWRIQVAHSGPADKRGRSWHIHGSHSVNHLSTFSFRKKFRLHRIERLPISGESSLNDRVFHWFASLCSSMLPLFVCSRNEDFT